MDPFSELFKAFGPQAAVLGVLATVIYKIYRVFKSDNRQDSFHADEQDFRKVLMDEVEKLRKEREDLIKASMPVEKRLFKLESNCASLKSYCRKCVSVLKTKACASDPEIMFLIKKGEELMDVTNSGRLVE